MAITFNSADKSATIALSGSDLIATNTGTVVNKAVRTTVSKSSGKWVFALTCTTLATGDDMAIGLATSGHPLNTRLEQATTAFGMDPFGNVSYNSSVILSVAPFTTGDKIYVAVDFADGFWIKVGSGGLWNGVNSNADVDAGLGDVNVPVAGAIFPTAAFWNSNGVWTLDPAATGHGLSTFAPWDTASTQTLTPSLFTNSNTFYGPTINRGAVTLSPSLFSNASTFYGPTITVGAVSLLPGLFTNSSTFYAANISQTGGSQTLTPTRFDNSSTFYAAALSLGAVTLTPARFDNTSTFYAATINQAAGNQTLTPSLVTNASVFYGATILQPSLQTLLPGLFTNASLFFAATVANDVPGGTYPEAIEGGGSVVLRSLTGGGTVVAGSISSSGRVIAGYIRGRP